MTTIDPPAAVRVHAGVPMGGRVGGDDVIESTNTQ